MDKTDAGTTINMDLFFNECSCEGLTVDTINEKVVQFANVVKEARRQGFHKVRYDKDMWSVELIPGMSFAQYCEQNRKNQVIITLLSLQCYPYFDNTREDDYLSADYSVVKYDGSVQSVYGLSAAYVYGSCGVGFETPDWSNLSYTLEVQKEDETIHRQILSFSSINHFTDERFLRWAEESLPEPVLGKSKTIPLEKAIHLPHHHGEDVLYAFSKRLVKCPYIEEIVCSIERRPKEKSFISSLHDGNMIDLRLIKSDGLGVMVRTTAENPRQLRAIARILEEKYSE